MNPIMHHSLRRRGHYNPIGDMDGSRTHLLQFCRLLPLLLGHHVISYTLFDKGLLKFGKSFNERLNFRSIKHEFSGFDFERRHSPTALDSYIRTPVRSGNCLHLFAYYCRHLS